MNLPDSHMNMGKNLCRLTPRIPYIEGILEARRQNQDLKHSFSVYSKVLFFTFLLEFYLEKMRENARNVSFVQFYYVRKSNSSVCFTPMSADAKRSKNYPELRQQKQKRAKINIKLAIIWTNLASKMVLKNYITNITQFC